MSSEITPEDIEALLPDEVRKVLAEEAEFIAARVRLRRAQGDSLIQSALTWLPYVGDVFEENEINTAAATSDINREERLRVVVDKVQAAFGGVQLGADTVDSFRRLVHSMYNTDIPLN
jgi:hypothetical protein